MSATQPIGDLALPLAKAILKTLAGYAPVGSDPAKLAEGLKYEVLIEDDVPATARDLGEAVEAELGIQLRSDIYNRLLTMVRATLTDLLMDRRVAAALKQPVAEDAFLEMAFEDRVNGGLDFD